MTTKMHRLTVSLPDDVLAAIKAMSESEERPMSKVIVSLLQEMAPAIVQLAKFQTQIKAGKTSEAKRTFQHLYGDGLAAMMNEQIDLIKPKKAKSGPTLRHD